MLWGNRQFAGILPRISPRLLPDNAAQIAENCWLDRGYPRPLPHPKVNSLGPLYDGDVETIYRFDGTDDIDDRWFAWDKDVDVVRAPVVNDTTRRTIWTGDDFPRMTSTAIMQGGTFTSPGIPVSRRLGIPAPANAPTVQIGAFTDEDTSGTAESHAWVFTWLSDLDEEGPPSPPSLILDRGFNMDGSIRPATITMPTAVTGPYGINRKRLYRTATDESGVTTYRLVATIAITTATYTDTVLTANLGDGIISTAWDPPPAGLTGLISLPNGVLAGFVGRDVYFSEPFQPHAWPEDYIHVVDADIVGLGNFGTNVVVGTQGKPYLISGPSPETSQMARVEFDQICAAKRSFATVEQQGIVFASPEGLVLIGPGGGRFLSRTMYDRRDWLALAPDEFRAVYHDGAYVAFSDAKGVALDPNMEGAVEIALAGVKAVFRDRERDKVYIVNANRRLAEWVTDGNGPYSLMTWKSKLHAGPARTFSAAQVIAEGYPVTLKLIGNGVERLSRAVMDNEPFRLPSMGLHGEWEYEIQAAHPVNEVRIGSMAEMIDA